VAIYTFNLAKLFNTFYAEHSISNAETEEKKQLRIKLGLLVAATLQKGMSALGIAVPEKM
jgi:arginyl-tRNA synthetase